MALKFLRSNKTGLVETLFIQWKKNQKVPQSDRLKLSQVAFRQEGKKTKKNREVVRVCWASLRFYFSMLLLTQRFLKKHFGTKSIYFLIIMFGSVSQTATCSNYFFFNGPCFNQVWFGPFWTRLKIKMPKSHSLCLLQTIEDFLSNLETCAEVCGFMLKKGDKKKERYWKTCFVGRFTILLKSVWIHVMFL